ncbi:uncharacterized protein LOC123865802 [Maniola jurtina]|uniref:uncharacterized protein LOC123865802 n=1 Tax=Maniola jurtina TaxID=191418 RepID=UPI001E688A59|nr:uncharacterized protein LOC123865802 [Maniola jurtina]
MRSYVSCVCRCAATRAKLCPSRLPRTPFAHPSPVLSSVLCRTHGRFVANMEQFIEVVKQFPVLWNTQLKDYHNLIKKDVVWKQIVEEISNPDIPDVKTAKNEWKKLRDSHRESLKRMKASTSGQAASPANNWKYAELLEFLLPHMKNRKRTGNVSINDKNTLASTSTQSQNTLPGTSIESQNTLPSTSTESQSTEIFEEIPNDDDENTSEPPRIKKKKVADDASLNDLLQKVDNDFMKRCEQREQRKAEEAKEAEKHRHPLNLFFDTFR